ACESKKRIQFCGNPRWISPIVRCEVPLPCQRNAHGVWHPSCQRVHCSAQRRMTALAAHQKRLTTSMRKHWDELAGFALQPSVESNRRKQITNRNPVCPLRRISSNCEAY